MTADEPQGLGEVDGIAQAFFAQVRAREAEEAVDNLFARSAVAMQLREKTALAAYIGNLLALNGALGRIELVTQATLGTLAIKRVYLAQLEKTVARWTFVLVHLPGGWSCVHLSVDEGAQSWL